MVKLRRGTQTAFSEAASLRLRAAWLYYNHRLTQKEVAEQLAISRTTVIRLLEEAHRRGEVRIWIEEGEADGVELALKLERLLKLDEAIVVPEARGLEQTSKSVGLGLGKFLSEAVSDNMTIGVGWGRTLLASLDGFRASRLEGVKVMSLLGGKVDAHVTNPVEYTWRLAAQMGADCYMFPAPLIVDSVETRTSLMDKCGLSRLIDLAENLDVAIVSVGDIGPRATSLSREFITETELAELIALGCVGDVLCNFLLESGETVPHPVNERIMSIDLDTLGRAKHIVIACGGAQRARAILSAIRRIGCNTLVTDEAAAKALLRLAG